MPMPKIILLRDELKLGVSQLELLSQQLNEHQIVLNFKGIDSLTESELQAIFSAIPLDYQIDQLYEIFDLDSIQEGLGEQITKFVKERSEEEKALQEDDAQIVELNEISEVNSIQEGLAEQIENLSDQGSEGKIDPLVDTTPNKLPPKPGLKWLYSIIGLSIVGAIFGIYLYLNSRSCSEATEKRLNGTCYKDLAKSSLVIGVVTSPEQYYSLVSYLKRSLGSSVKEVIIDQAEIDEDSPYPYQASKDRIATQKWDIAYTYSPTNSIVAVDRGYKWVGKMFPHLPDYYQSALFVKKGSSIESPDEIKSSTKVALGNFGSASTFYLPAYIFYGRSLSVVKQSKNKTIINLVKSGEADIGVATLNRVQNDPDLQIISQSKDLPGAGVFISPKISPEEQKKITKLLLDAPKEIISKDQANGPGGSKELDYEYFRQLTLRAEEVIKCSDFTRNPVQFFCNSSVSKFNPNEGIIGEFTEWSKVGKDEIKFRLKAENAKYYSVTIPVQVMSGISGCTTPMICHGKRVQILNAQPITSGGNELEIKIKEPEQINLIK